MISFAGVDFENPVVAASGTAGYGVELEGLAPVPRLGGLVLKALTLEAREGNPFPRIAETEAGLLNSVGLQNEGLEAFLSHVVPELSRLPIPVIANLSGNRVEDYVALVEALNGVEKISLLELNVSCPNVHGGRIEFGTDAKSLGELVAACARVAKKPIMPKLTPNVTDIAELAAVCEASGANAVSLVNTFLGMRIDPVTRRPAIARITGGYSGPGIKPIALRMVYQVARRVKVPILGLGGIRTGEDAAEFLMAGAKLVGVGAAGSMDPGAPHRVRKQLDRWLKGQKLDYASARGAMIVD